MVDLISAMAIALLACWVVAGIVVMVAFVVEERRSKK